MQAEFNAEQIASLGSWRMWRQLVRNRALEEASVGVELDEQELETAWQEFCQRHSLQSGTNAPVPPELSGTTPDMLRDVAERDLRISRWKERVFGTQAEEHFKRRKADLDRVVYSLLRLDNSGLARELWFRLNEDEASFAELAAHYSAGDEMYTGGLVGPVTLGSIHPSLAHALRSAHPGNLLPPFQVADWHVVARLEHNLPAELDSTTRRRMIDELAAHWLEQHSNGTGNT